MTEHDIVDAIASFYGLILTAIGLYVSVCSAYLIAAYLVGSNLTKFQTAVVSALFFFVSAVMTYAVFGWFNRTFSYLEALQKVGDSGLGASSNPLIGPLFTLIMVAGILACLKFMWDVRHPSD